LLVLSVAGVALSACSASVSSGNFPSDSERAYSQSVQSGFAKMSQVAPGLHPVCDLDDPGRQRERSFDASQRMIGAIAATQQALAAQAVPSRFAAAHADLLRGLATYAEAFRVRNRGITTRNTVDYAKGQSLIPEGVSQISAALSKYPADAGLKL
jgi:hypothetical protein